jgi:L-aspartate oxidase
MQKAYFVLPNVKELGPGLEKVTQIKDMLYSGNYKIDKDYVEAKSLATVAYIVLSEAWKIATQNAEMIRKKRD